MAKLEFWYDLASTYSYLAAMRIEELCAAADLEVAWKPFLLGPIFKAQGWETSPFNIYPAKGRYMLRDMERTCRDRGLPFAMPTTFPAASLLAVRVAYAGEVEGWTGRFTRAAFSAQFGASEEIADPAVISRLLSEIGLDPQSVLARAASPQVKDGLKTRTAQAQALGIFGAPSFVTASGTGTSEVFWGDDRLEQAIRWAMRKP